jgi:hypothetical protein
MKNVANLWAEWEDPTAKFIGSNKPNGIVTVETDWIISSTEIGYGTASRGPYRWFQKADGSQTELEVPQIKSISIDESIDTDASTCNINIYNIFNEDYGVSPALESVLGQPGALTWSYGETDRSAVEWGQVKNAWYGILVPNALLRTYQGYGGNDLTRTAAMAAGNIVRTGTWMIDKVTVGTDGMLNIQCRSVAKLLIDQTLYPPLVPTHSEIYPLEYNRYFYPESDPDFAPIKEESSTITTNQDASVNLTYKNSSGDFWYGADSSVHGHKPTDSLDGRLDTFALGVGNTPPSASYAADYFEYAPDGPINDVFVHPVMGNYEMYICIYENGEWLSNGEGVIYYDKTPLDTSQPGSSNPDTGTATTFVLKTSVPYETGQWYKLPRIYNADRVRLTFRNLQYMQWGPYHYRVGLREVKARLKDGSTTETINVEIPVWTRSMAKVKPGGSGYYVIDDSANVNAFGTGLERTPKTGSTYAPAIATSISTSVDGSSYAVMYNNGKVECFGSLTWIGDPLGTPTSQLQSAVLKLDYIDIAVNNNSTGYWVVDTFGRIDNYGTSAYADFSANTSAIEAAPSGEGLWAVSTAGVVSTRGSATGYGNWSSALSSGEKVVDISSNAAGTGYWLLTSLGRVEAKGSTTHYGEFSDTVPADYNDNYEWLAWSLSPAEGDLGYYILRSNGQVSPFGTAFDYGGPSTGGNTREDGNYFDYTDIVKELLLWSGYTLYDPAEAGEPQVHGNIELTGVHGGSNKVGTDLFDKRSPIDAINEFSEITGYITYTDSDGGFHFHTPNWWTLGNFYQDGTYTNYVPEISDRQQLTSYKVSYGDSPMRSQIIIGSEVPVDGNITTATTVLVPDDIGILRGMVKPAMWINRTFSNVNEQEIMSELIAMHIWFQQRVGSVECLAMPALEINDQVRIMERNSSDTYIHYIRGLSTNMDLETGSYTMNLTTHWLGSDDKWSVALSDVQATSLAADQIQLSLLVQTWMSGSENEGIQALLTGVNSAVAGQSTSPLGVDPGGLPSGQGV